MTLTTSTQPATDKQVTFILDLAGKRDWDKHMNGRPWETVFDTLGNVGNPDPKFIGKAEASAAIDFLLSCRPHTQVEHVAKTNDFDLTTLPLVKFALPRTNGTGVDFFELVERKNGRRFVNRLLGSPGDWNRERLSTQHQVAAARAFSKDVKAAMNLYSDEFRVCSKCDAPLSDERSRAARLGYTCAKKLGRDW